MWSVEFRRWGMWLFRLDKRGWNCACNIFSLSVISSGYGAFPREIRYCWKEFFVKHNGATWRLTNVDVHSLPFILKRCAHLPWLPLVFWTSTKPVEISAGYWCSWEHRTWSHCTYVLWSTLVYSSRWGTFWNQASIEYARCTPYETKQNNGLYETITVFIGAVLVFLSSKVNPILPHQLIILSTVVHSYLLLLLLVITSTSDCFTPFIFS
jgi:hypothetical protein